MRDANNSNKMHYGDGAEYPLHFQQRTEQLLSLSVTYVHNL